MITQVPSTVKQQDALQNLRVPNPFRRPNWPNLYRGPGLPVEGIGTIEPPEKVDIDLIFDSIETIIMTHQGERLLEPEFGSRIRELIGEPIKKIFEAKLYDFLTRAVKQYEPRARVKGVQVTFSDSTANVTYALEIVQLGITATDTFKIPRLV